MDYLKEFEQNCKAIIKQFEVVESNAPTKNQRATEFNRELEDVWKKIESKLNINLESISKLAQKDNYKEIYLLEKKMKLLITDYGRQFKNDQKEKSGYE